MRLFLTPNMAAVTSLANQQYMIFPTLFQAKRQCYTRQCFVMYILPQLKVARLDFLGAIPLKFEH